MSSDNINLYNDFKTHNYTFYMLILKSLNLNIFIKPSRIKVIEIYRINTRTLEYPYFQGI